jgi:hypothetical protein
MFLYVDNILIGSINDSSVGSSGIPFLIGSNGDTYTFPSSIDEVGVWNRLLSDQEVSDLWNGGAGLTYPFGQITGNGINTKYIYDLIKLPWFIRDGGKDSFISGMLKLPWFINI